MGKEKEIDFEVRPGRVVKGWQRGSFVMVVRDWDGRGNVMGYDIIHLDSKRVVASDIKPQLAWASLKRLGLVKADPNKDVGSFLTAVINALEDAKRETSSAVSRRR